MVTGQDGGINLKIDEIVLKESYFDELMTNVQNLLVRITAKEITEIPTEKFQQLLAKQGYTTTMPELIAAVDQSGFASSVDAEKIVPMDQMSADVDTDPAHEFDVARSAETQAMKDIKSEI